MRKAPKNKKKREEYRGRAVRVDEKYDHPPSCMFKKNKSKKDQKILENYYEKCCKVDYDEGEHDRARTRKK